MLSGLGYEPVAAAVVEAFSPEIDDALEHPVDFKSALQERLARRGSLVTYTVVEESGPPARPDVLDQCRGRRRRAGPGTGRSKKDAEQEAAQLTLETLE